jgi:hypothetical protein
MKSLYNYFEDLQCGMGRHFHTYKIESKKPDIAVWNNTGFKSDSIRYGHVEYFKSNNNKVEVVHVMCYPHFYRKLPVFGFDVIALNGTITGLFCDITPLPFDNFSLRKQINQVHNQYIDYKRTLPEWTSMFSLDFIAVSPKDKFEEIAEKCLDLYRSYLHIAELESNCEKLSPQQSQIHKEQQNLYSSYQQKNTKTAKALAAYIGEEESNKFIKEILFPVVD